jgi:hypothetical protein
MQFLKAEGLTLKLSYLLNTKTLHSVHTVYLCVPYELRSKQRLFL